MSQHKTLLRSGNHANKHLQSAWDKYGEDAFKFFVIDYCPIKYLNICEEELISLYNSNNNQFGYNIRKEAVSNRGLHWSEEQRKKMLKAIEKNPYYHNHNIPRWIMEKAWESNRNRIWTEEERLIHSKKLRGLKVKDTSKMKLAQQGENNPSNKLTIDEVKEILCLLENCQIEQKYLAEVYNVSKSNINAIWRRRSWKNITLEEKDKKYYYLRGLDRVKKYERIKHGMGVVNK